MGAAAVATRSDTSARMVTYQGKSVMAIYRAFDDGYQGFVPITASYTGNGDFMPTGFQGPGLHPPYHDTDFQQLNSATGEAKLAISPNVFSEHAGTLLNPSSTLPKSSKKHY